MLVLNTGNTGTIDIPSGVTLTVPGLITGGGTLNKTGAGTVVFPGSNNAFTGILNVNGGTFRVADTGAGGDFGAASIIINNGGTFDFVGPDGNADLPAATVITINTGGLARFQCAVFLKFMDNLHGGEVHFLNFICIGDAVQLLIDELIYLSHVAFTQGDLEFFLKGLLAIGA